MKVYKKFQEYNFTHPEDMNLILDYLNKHGEILIENSSIESLYYDFSDERYSAGWIGVNDDTLEEFAEWLDKYEL